MSALSVVSSPPSQSQGSSLLKDIESRATNEIIIAFTGMMGSGISKVVTTFGKKFQKKGYETEHIKLSDFLKKEYSSVRSKLEDKRLNYNELNENIDKLTYYQKITTLQSIGNYLRSNYNNSILSQYALTTIFNNKIGQDIPEEELEHKLPEIIEKYKDKNIKRVTFIDSIKHIDEYNLLKTVYSNMFYMVGILCPEKIRKDRIRRDEDIEKEPLQELIDRDKKEDIDSGQQSLKVLQESDMFLRNISEDGSNDIIERYVDLMLGEPFLKPTIDEFGMFTAQASAQQSGCISRQVGAAIFNKHNDIISTGCNDAPIYGGGHYASANIIPDAQQLKDNRCCSLQDNEKCKNTEQLENILSEIKSIVKEETSDIDHIDSEKLSEIIFKNTRIKSLIEFSKAVHAEMDAITTAARNGSNALKGATLYCTTFPCHLCATNIIATGIEKVVYIEPYLKSLAVELHKDQVNFDPKTINPKDNDNKNKVLFLPFEGVAPKQYLNFFKSCDRKAKDGTKIKYDIRKAIPALKQMMDPYTDYELAIAKSFKEQVNLGDENE